MSSAKDRILNLKNSSINAKRSNRDLIVSVLSELLERVEKLEKLAKETKTEDEPKKKYSGK